LATAGGTLILAVATFSSVRSANRSARTAERSLLAGLRPVLIPSRLQDPPQKIMWSDRHWASIPGGCASVEILDDIVYLAMSLRNVGTGIAVMHGWDPIAGLQLGSIPHVPPEEFRLQTRDLYIPAGDTSFWQGALREVDDPDHKPIRTAVETRTPFTVDLLYGDFEGGQRVVSRVTVIPRDGEQTAWLLSSGRHWHIDRPDPR
jgi:hypothetical protein